MDEFLDLDQKIELNPYTLSKRTIGVLKEEKIHTVRHLLELSLNKVMMYPNAGRQTLQQIIQLKIELQTKLIKDYETIKEFYEKENQPLRIGSAIDHSDSREGSTTV